MAKDELGLDQMAQNHFDGIWVFFPHDHDSTLTSDVLAFSTTQENTICFFFLGHLDRSS